MPLMTTGAGTYTAIGGGGGGASFDVIFSAGAMTGTLGSTYTCANLVKASGVTNMPPGSVTKVKVTIDGPVTRVYIGHKAAAGDAYDAASLTQVLFGGSASLSQANGASTESDECSFAWDKTSDIIISVEKNGSNIGYKSISSTIGTTYNKSGVLEADVADKTGYASFGGDYSIAVTTLKTNGFP